MNLKDLARLSVAERLQAMETLWESLVDGGDKAIEAPAWHAEILAERARSLDDGSEPLIDWDEAKLQILQPPSRG